jgi:hypothetical protein
MLKLLKRLINNYDTLFWTNAFRISSSIFLLFSSLFSSCLSSSDLVEYEFTIRNMVIMKNKRLFMIIELLIIVNLLDGILLNNKQK